MIYFLKIRIIFSGGVYILTALNDQKEIFTITTHVPTETLIQLRKTMTFYCPQCENPVRLKIGQVMIPHFAHIVLSDCLTSFSERESPIHLKGKLQLAEFFEEKSLEIFVESYLPELCQRPDILVKSTHQSYAIEFQCCTIPIEVRDMRSKGYLKSNIEPIWILRSFEYPEVPLNGIVIIQLTHFRQAFIQHDDCGDASIIAYDPNTEQFIYYAHLIHLQGTRFIAKIGVLPRHLQSFPFRQLKPLTSLEGKVYWDIFQRYRKRFLKNAVLTSKKGVRDPFLRICYVNHLQPIELPLFIGIPLGTVKHINGRHTEWQFAFIHMCMQQQIQFHAISNEQIEFFLLQNLRENNYKLARELCISYIQILIQLGLKVDSSLLKQKIPEEKLLEIFLQLIVAKRTEY